MLYSVCPTCAFLLADKELIFESKLEEIEQNKSLSESDKQQEVEKLLNELGVKRYCCRMRMISYIDLVNLIV